MATKARHLKTPLQLWVADNRKRLGLTPGDLAQMTGVTTDTARGWESRGRPSEDAIAVLERRFGLRAPREAQGAVGDAGLVAVAQAIEAQTKAIEDLATVLREGQDRQTGAFDGLADGLLALLSRLTSEHAEPQDGSVSRRAGKL